MDAAYDLRVWHDFAVAFVSASAALLGLVFVVVSLHLRAVVDDPVLRRRAEIMLGLLATMLAASAALVVPGLLAQLTSEIDWRWLCCRLSARRVGSVAKGSKRRRLLQRPADASAPAARRDDWV